VKARKTHGLSSTKEYTIWSSCKRIAKKRGIEFNLEVTDIKIPDKCPIFGMPLDPCIDNQRAANSPSIDRIDNKRGYTKDNIWIISWRANYLKSNSTLEELRVLVAGLENKLAAK